MLTEKELLILSHLRENSRKTITDIAKETGIPKSTVFDNINKLKTKVIKKNVSLLDFSKVGYGLRVNFAIKAKNKKEAREFLANHKNVNSVYKTTNNFDFYIEAIFKNMKEMHDFKDELDNLGIKRSEEHFLIDDIKREGFMLRKE